MKLLIKKIFCLTLLFQMILGQCLASVSQPNFWRTRQNASVLIEQSSYIQTNLQTLQQELIGKAQIASFRSQDSKATVILIQDLHQFYSYQKNVAAILETLSHFSKSPLIVGVEGAVKTVEGVEHLKQFPHKNALQRSCEILLQIGKISGAEKAALTQKNKITLYGLEDEFYYHKQLQNFQTQQLSQKNLSLWLAAKQQKLDTLKKQTYSPELLDWDNVIQNYQEQKISLADFLNKFDLKLASYPQLLKYSQLQKIENSINFAQLQLDQKKLVQELSTKLSNKQTQELFNQSLNARITGNSIEFYQKLLSLSQQNKIHFPQKLQQYLDYLTLTQTIKIDLLEKEIDLLKQNKLQQILNHSSQKCKQVYQQQTNFTLLRNALEFKLNYSQWQEIQNKKKDSEFLSQLKLAPIEIKKIWVNVLNFNQLSDLRSKNFVDNFLKIAQDQELAGVIISGGFHSEKIKEHLIEQHYNVMVLTPCIKEKTNFKFKHPLQHFKNYSSSFNQFLSLRQKQKTTTLAAPLMDRELADHNVSALFAPLLALNSLPRQIQDLAQFLNLNPNRIIIKRHSDFVSANILDSRFRHLNLYLCNDKTTPPISSETIIFKTTLENGQLLIVTKNSNQDLETTARQSATFALHTVVNVATLLTLQIGQSGEIEPSLLTNSIINLALQTQHQQTLPGKDFKALNVSELNELLGTNISFNENKIYFADTVIELNFTKRNSVDNGLSIESTWTPPSKDNPNYQINILDDQENITQILTGEILQILFYKDLINCQFDLNFVHQAVREFDSFISEKLVGKKNSIDDLVGIVTKSKEIKSEIVFRLLSLDLVVEKDSTQEFTELANAGNVTGFAELENRVLLQLKFSDKIAFYSITPKLWQSFHKYLSFSTLKQEQINHETFENRRLFLRNNIQMQRLKQNILTQTIDTLVLDWDGTVVPEGSKGDQLEDGISAQILAFLRQGGKLFILSGRNRADVIYTALKEFAPDFHDQIVVIHSGTSIWTKISKDGNPILLPEHIQSKTLEQVNLDIETGIKIIENKLSNSGQTLAQKKDEAYQKGQKFVLFYRRYDIPEQSGFAGFDFYLEGPTEKQMAEIAAALQTVYPTWKVEQDKQKIIISFMRKGEALEHLYAKFEVNPKNALVAGDARLDFTLIDVANRSGSLALFVGSHRVLDSLNLDISPIHLPGNEKGLEAAIKTVTDQKKIEEQNQDFWNALRSNLQDVAQQVQLFFALHIAAPKTLVNIAQESFAGNNLPPTSAAPLPQQALDYLQSLQAGISPDAATLLYLNQQQWNHQIPSGRTIVYDLDSFTDDSLSRRMIQELEADLQRLWTNPQSPKIFLVSRNTLTEIPNALKQMSPSTLQILQQLLKEQRVELHGNISKPMQNWAEILSVKNGTILVKTANQGFLSNWPNDEIEIWVIQLSGGFLMQSLKTIEDSLKAITLVQTQA